jgi:hypothetical protein
MREVSAGRTGVPLAGPVPGQQVRRPETLLSAGVLEPGLRILAPMACGAFSAVLVNRAGSISFGSPVVADNR